jgi:hypothetical protein
MTRNVKQKFNWRTETVSFEDAIARYEELEDGLDQLEAATDAQPDLLVLHEKVRALRRSANDFSGRYREELRAGKAPATT